eukprot:TRINITY_DN1655_c0_g1_i1.p1 TRINITY_DN1655_c0_g1~~TRINITY_DN1655_c0_g1_i1.p1  ORF type:complete len:368 (-),score=77.65 TRINITY_DN1655_c0_g1_i1:523-1626(-)
MATLTAFQIGISSYRVNFSALRNRHEHLCSGSPSSAFYPVHGFSATNCLCRRSFSDKRTKRLPKGARGRDVTFSCLSVGKRTGEPVTEAKDEATNKAQIDVKEGEGVSEEEGETSWINERAEELVEFTESVADAIPGPRVGSTQVPWLLALPLAYLTISFVIALTRTIKKLNSPRQRRRRLVNKNSMLCKALDDLLLKKGEFNSADLERLAQKTDFRMEEILRKYIRYALNEKPFNLNLVGHLISLRRATMLDDAEVAEVLNEISRRIVKDKGPVLLNTSGFTEEGMKRKIAVQALFSKILYLSELKEFCPTGHTLLRIKEIFGVAGDDLDTFRLEALSEASDMEFKDASNSNSLSDLEEPDIEEKK